MAEFDLYFECEDAKTQCGDVACRDVACRVSTVRRRIFAFKNINGDIYYFY